MESCIPTVLGRPIQVVIFLKTLEASFVSHFYLKISLELDRSRELEVAVYWRDYRAMSALRFLRLEDYIDTQQVFRKIRKKKQM